MANNKIDIASLTKEQFHALKSGEVVLVPVDFIADTHKYDYQKAISTQMKKEFGDANFMSASKLGEILKGQDKQSIMALKEVVKTLDPIKNAADILKYQKMISAAEARQAAFSKSDANVFGTAFHKIVELIEGGNIGKNGMASGKEIVQYLRSDKGRADKELEIVAKFIKNEKGEGNANTRRLLENVRQYLDFKDKAGLKGEVLSEQHVAAFIKVGDQMVKIAGTFDQLWKNLNTLTDLKTSAKTSPEYGMQLNAYARLIEAATGIKPTTAKVLQTPRAATSSAGINEVKIATNEQIDAMLGAAYKIYSETDVAKRVAAIEEAQTKNFERAMGFQSRLERVEREGTKGKWTDTLINGRSITGGYARKNWTPDELVKAISLLPADDREDALRLVFGTVDYQTNPNSPKGYDVIQRERGYHYNDGTTKNGEEIPGFWYKTRQGLIESGVVRGTRASQYKPGNEKYAQGYFKFDKSYWDMYNSPWWDVGYGQSIAKEERTFGTEEEDYQPDWYDASSRNRYGKVIERLDKIADPYGSYAEDRDSYKFKEWSSGIGTKGSAQQTGYRIARLVDLSNRIDDYFETIYKQIGYEGSLEEKQKLTASWLAENNSALYDQYKESQELSTKYKTENIASLPKEDQLSWIIEQANRGYTTQVEEWRAVVDAYTTLIKESPSLKEEVLKAYHPESFGKTSPYMLGTIEEAVLKEEGIGDYGRDEYVKHEKEMLADISRFDKTVNVADYQIDDFDDLAAENQAIANKLKDAKISESIIEDLIGLREILDDATEDLKEALSLEDKAWEEVDDFYKDAKGNAAADFEERKRAAEALLYTESGEYSDFLDSGISDYVAEQRKIYEKRVSNLNDATKQEEQYNEDIKKIRDEEISNIFTEKRKSGILAQKQKEQEDKNDQLAQEYARKVEAARQTVEAEKSNAEKVEQQAVINEEITQKKEEEKQAASDVSEIVASEEAQTKPKKKRTYKKRTPKTAASSAPVQGACCENVEHIDTNVDKITNEYFPALFEWLKGVHEAILSQSYGKPSSSGPAIGKGGGGFQQSPENVYVRALKEEYDLRTKIEKLKYNKENKATTEEEIKAYETLIAVSERQLELKKQASEKAASAVENKEYANDLLLAKRAELELYKNSLGSKGGGGAQKQSIWDQMGFSKDGLTRTITQFFSLYRVLGKVRQVIQKVITITKELDKAATNIRIVTGKERAEVDNLILSYSKLASQIGSTTTAVAESANTWLRQGYNINEVNKLIKASTELSKLGMLDINSATKVLTSTLKGFKMEASEATSIVDKFTKLDTKFAASAGEIGEALSRAASLAQQSGMSLDQASAFVTTIMDITQQSAEMAGTSLRTILARYGNVKAGSFVNADEDDVENINDIEKVLNRIGITIRSSNSDMRAFSDVLDDISEKWLYLTDVEKNAIATAVAGELAPEHTEMCA